MADKKTQKLLVAAQNSYPAIDASDIRCDQVKDYASRIADLRDKKEEIIAKIVALSVDRKEYHILCSFPEIGELGDLRRFKNAKQLNAYVGI